MNKIFRVVWSHAAQSWVAVSELTSAKGKTKSKTMSKLAALSLVVGSAVSMDVLAAETTITATATSKDSNILIGNVDNITRDLPVVPKNMIIIGNNTKAQGKAAPNAPGFKQVDDEEIIIGNDMTALNSGRAADTIIGNRIRFGGSGNDSMSTAMGYGAHVSSSSVSIGVGARSDVGSYQPWEEPMAGGVAVGQFSSAGGNTNSVVSIGAGSGGTRDKSVNIGVLSGASDLFYDREVAEPGNGGKVYSFGSSSFGAVSVGYKAAAGGQYGVAIGEGSIVSRNGSRSAMAMGHSSTSIGENSIAIGENSVAGGHTEAQIKTLNSKLTTLKGDKFLGTAVTRLEAAKEKMQALPNTENKFQVASAQAALDRINFEIARLEREITFLASGTTATTSAIAIGNSSAATNESALAIGDRANSTGKASIAQGKQATVTAENAISVGTSSNVSGENSVALGANITKLTTANSVVLGANSTEVVETTGASHAVQTVNDATVRTIAGPNFTYSGFVGKPADAGHYVSIGQAGKERQIKNLAAGAVTPTSTDAINGSQLYALMDRVENKQEPVVYTNKAGDKLVKVGDKFYKTTDLNDKGQPNNVNQNVPNDDVIASMNNAGNNTTTPMALANIAGNLPGAKNGSTAPTTSGTLPEGADAPNTSNAATVGDVLNAGWNLTEKGEARDFVKPYDTVDFKDGKGTSVNVTTDTDGKVSHIKYDVKAADDSITVGDDGIKVNTGGIAPVTQDEGDKKSGQVAPNKGDENKVASVGDVANAINNAFWKATGATDGGEFADGNNTTEEAVKAGDKVTFKAGKNIKLKQDGKNFTYSLNPVLTDMTSIGGNGTTMTFNPNGVDLGDKNITGVKSALNTTPVTTTPDGSPTADADKPNLVDLVGTTDAPVNKNAAATVGDLQNMGWVVSSDKTTDALDKAYKDTVKNANEVKFVGTGAATVSGKTVNGIRTITVDVKQPKPETETLTSTGGKVDAPTSGDKLVTAGNVANMINNSGFTLKADKVEGGENTTDGDNANNEKLTEKGELIKPGSTVTMKAGKNMTVKHEANGNITYATKDDVEFNTVKVGDDKDGKSPVEFKTEAAKPATNNVDGKQPTTALNVTSADGKPTQITGVASSLNKAPVTTAPNVNLVDLNSPNVNSNAAATVGDLQNMGWVVSTKDGNGYIADVKNANHVDFKAGPGISVTGKTTDDGIREITIGVKDGEVVKPNQFTAKVNGTDTPVTKVGDQYYNTADIDPKTGKPKADKKPVTPDAGTTPTNAGDGYVTGNKVAAAIQKSGFVVGKQKDALSAADFKDEDEKVNPDDELRFADGNNTKVKLATKESVDKDGNKVTTTTVKVDVTGLPVQYTDKNGTPVTKVGDKYFTVDDKGNPTATEVKPADLTTNMVNPAAAPNVIGAPTALGNVKSNLPSVNDADKNAKDVDGKPIAGKDNKSAPITAKEAADIVNKAGNNAATVSDVLNAGWNLQNNGEARDFVKPYDTVNFINGKGTVAVVETADDAASSTVKFDVDAGEITSNTNGSVNGPTTAENAKKLADDLKKAEQAVKDLPADATPEAKKAAQDALKAAQAAAAPLNKVATAQNVADMINASGFTLKTSKAEGGEKDAASTGDEVINPGKAVEMVAGKNLTVKQESNGKVTYSTASNVTFDSVQFGDNGPKITNNGGNINVGTATGAPTKITGVAPGAISATSTDAINGSQLHSVAAGINNRIGSLENKIDMADKNLRGGVAQAIAAAGLVQAYLPGKSLVAIGGGVYRGEAGYAIGYSSISDNGNWIIKGTASGNSRGHFGASSSVGYQW